MLVVADASWASAGVLRSKIVRPKKRDGKNTNSFSRLDYWANQRDRVLVILDDCAVSADVKRRTSALIDLAFSGRHIQISLWVVTQQLTSIAKPFRENLGCIVAFPEKDSTDKLFSSFGSAIDKDEKADICKILKKEKHSHLQILLCHPFSYVVTIPVLSKE